MYSTILVTDRKKCVILNSCILIVKIVENTLRAHLEKSTALALTVSQMSSVSSECGEELLIWGELWGGSELTWEIKEAWRRGSGEEEVASFDLQCPQRPVWQRLAPREAPLGGGTCGTGMANLLELSMVTNSLRHHTCLRFATTALGGGLWREEVRSLRLPL